MKAVEALDTDHKCELQEELLKLFERYGLSVAVGITAKGVMIGSQDERVDATNIGEVSAYSGS